MTAPAFERRARIFRNGRSRAVRIPAEFELNTQEVVMRQDADGTIVMRPAPRSGLAELLASLQPLPPEAWLPEITDDDLLPLDEDPFS